MAKNIIGFNSEDDFDRMSRSVRKSENTPQVGQQQRAKYPQGTNGLQIRRAVISKKGVYNTHKVLFTSGTFTEDTTTDDVDATVSETVAYVGEEFDFRIEVGDPVRVAKFANRWWIIDAQQACRGYCIDDPDGQTYVYGWQFTSPPLTCCPEASGTHILTTSDSGATYESATFQCNSDGTDRKWIFDGTKLYLSPMLDDGNIEYRTDRTVANCSVELQKYESSIFPKVSDCGKLQESVCIHPLCGVFSCTYAPNGAPVEYTALFDSGSNLTYQANAVLKHEGAVVASECRWQNYQDYPNAQSVELQISTAPANHFVRVNADAVYRLESGIDFSPWEENIFYITPEDEDPKYPSEITILPNTIKAIESDCKPLQYFILHEDGTTGTDVICRERPYYSYFVVSGVTNSGCTDCNDYNGTFILEYDNSANSSSATISNTCSASGTSKWNLSYYRNSPVPDESGMKLAFGVDLVVYLAENLDSNYTDKECLRGPVVFTYDSDNSECANLSLIHV